ncbi:MAG: AbrB/MazE/SpoVT family DNA-binding domain-containing protein [Nitrospirae bacterium]|nr:AbrB/MazE/SpoVT family DNA-binding domain-containing protein [Nitrospirota bacterium]
MTTAAVKITRKGQVTLPKEIRERLKTDAVYFEVEDDIVMVRPVRDASGSLSEYAGNVKPAASMKQMKDKAWEVAVREKSGKKSSRH